MSQTNHGSEQQRMRLDQLRPGQSAEIEHIVPAVAGGASQTADLNRLMEIGLIPGQSVEMIKAAPLGDPLEIRLMDYSLVLRKADAAQILIKTQPL